MIGTCLPRSDALLKGDNKEMKLWFLTWHQNIACLLSMFAIFATTATPAISTEKVTGSYWYIVDNIQDTAEGTSGYIWIALPADRPEQKVQITKIDPKPIEIITDPDHGNKIVVWRVTPDSKTTFLNYHYEFTAELEPFLSDINPQDVQTPDKSSSLYRRFTQPEFGIEIDQDIQDLAAAIVGPESNPYLQAKLIYNWIVANLKFVPGSDGEFSASWVSGNRQGDCVHYSLLFTSLCRALGIPARTFACEWLSGGRHVLAEFFIHPYGWLPADPSAAQLLQSGFTGLSEEEVAEFIKSRGIPHQDPSWLFGNLYQNRLITTVGNNIEIISKENNKKHVFTFLYPGGVDADPPAYEFEAFNSDIVHGGFFHFGDNNLDEEAIQSLAHQRLAILYFDAGLVEKAEEGCLSTIQYDPTGVSAWINLGRVYLRKGAYSKAEASFKRALTGYTALPVEKLERMIWVHNYLGNCYDLLGERDLALAEYKQVVEMEINYRGAVEYARKYMNSPFKVSDF